jgi:hypothetical protein
MCQEMGFSRNYFVEEKPVDQVHGSVYRAGPVHHGPVTIAARGSSPELGLRPLWCPRAPTNGWGRGRMGRRAQRRGHRGLWGGGGLSHRRQSLSSEGRRCGLREGVLEVWGSSPRARQPFIGRRRGEGGRVPSIAGVEGASMPLDWRHRLPGIEEGEGRSLMFKWRRSDAAVIFPSLEVVGADHGGGARPTGGGSLRALLRCRRRKKTAGWAVWA